MNVIRKDATITNTDEEFPGGFKVILSTPSKDRDGDELKAEDWQQPLPEHITFDIDHGLSVASTVGSGHPSIDDQGRLIVDGTYSSLPRAQEVRTLVNEGHIRTTSVAFSTSKTTKDGKTRVTRELLNGAFVAVPANAEALVLASKGLKAGARNSASDAAHIQAIYDHAVALGAGSMDDTGAEEGAVGGKGLTIGEVTVEMKTQPVGLTLLCAQLGLKAKYDAETLRQMLKDGEAIENVNGDPSYPIGDKEDLENAIHAVGRGQGDHDKIRAYIIRRAKDLGVSDLIPDDWNSDGSMKSIEDAQTKAIDPNAMISINMNGSAGGFDITINAWCVPSAESDAYADSAQRILAAALEIASEGPVDDDHDASSADIKNLHEETTPKSEPDDADALAMEAKMLALQVIASAAD